MKASKLLRIIFVSVGLAPLGSCLSVSKEDRLLTSGPVGDSVGGSSFGQSDFGILSWNIHKAAHENLIHDLSHHAVDNDLLLLQEVVMDAPMRKLLTKTGFSWQMADAFSVSGRVRGVLVAARAQPLSGRVMRTNEPLFPIPKSVIVTRYLIGRQRLAVANLHGINFSLGLGRFREQLEEVASDLRDHEGPIILGGDFNTWSKKRHAALDQVAHQLGLTAVDPHPDERRRAFGRHLDHLFVRGFTVLSAHSPEARSSDHNPILVRLRSQRSSGP